MTKIASVRYKPVAAGGVHQVQVLQDFQEADALRGPQQLKVRIHTHVNPKALRLHGSVFRFLHLVANENDNKSFQ